MEFSIYFLRMMKLERQQVINRLKNSGDLIMK